MLVAIATWVIPAGVYNLNALGEPIPGTYHEVASQPAHILRDSLTAPLNGLYGIEDAKGNINYYNSGSLFGAVDIAIFILVIGGFLGVTMKTGAIQAGIGALVERMRGRERWLIPVLMSVFALGGTTFGMAEEGSLIVGERGARSEIETAIRPRVECRPSHPGSRRSGCGGCRRPTSGGASTTHSSSSSSN